MHNKESRYFEKSGHLSEIGMSLYVSALIGSDVENLNSELLIHVESCKVCKSHILESYRIYMFTNAELNDKSKKLTFDEGKSSTKKLLFINVFKIAASLFVVVGLGYLLFAIIDFNTGNNKIAENQNDIDSINNDNEISIPKIVSDPEPEESFENSLKTNVTDTTINIKLPVKIVTSSHFKKSEMLAVNFEESPNLENFINVRLRNPNVLSVISPLISDTLLQQGKIIFKWRTSIDQDLVLKLFSNKEELLITVDVGKKKEFILNKELQAGLFYWKLETEDDLYFTGKFFIK